MQISFPHKASSLSRQIAVRICECPYARCERGGVFFDGELEPYPIEGYPNNPGTLVEADEYFWLQNWSNVILFPAPVVESRLTYSFKVLVQVATLVAVGSPLGWSYVSVGETANYTGQEELTVDTSLGFPLAMADLNPPNGLTRGQLAVQRSFLVGGGHVPALAMILGFAVGLSRKDHQILFDDIQDCFILPGSDAGGEGVVSFRYDPLLPARLPPGD